MPARVATFSGMASTHVSELTDANFETEVVKSDLPALVDFTAAWCAPCRVILPTITAIADSYQGRVKVGKLDVDLHQVTAQRYNVRSMPTLLFFKGGRVVGQIIGAVPRQKVEAELAKHL